MNAVKLYGYEMCNVEKITGCIFFLLMFSGLFLTVALAILLCCRLKMIRRRLRKGGKSAYAHDADFLVNGMYL